MMKLVSTITYKETFEPSIRELCCHDRMYLIWLRKWSRRRYKGAKMFMFPSLLFKTCLVLLDKTFLTEKRHKLALKSIYLLFNENLSLAQKWSFSFLWQHLCTISRNIEILLAYFIGQLLILRTFLCRVFIFNCSTCNRHGLY